MADDGCSECCIYQRINEDFLEEDEEDEEDEE